MTAGSPMRIGEVELGHGHPVRIVAELGSSHCGSIDKAKELIDAAHAAGADLVKMQIYMADEMCLPGVPCPAGPWEGQDLYELYKSAGTPWEWWPILRDYATSKGVTLFSSAFSVEAIDYLLSEGCPAIKVSSHDTCLVVPRGVPTVRSVNSRDDARAAVCERYMDMLLWCPGGYPAADLDPLDMGWIAGLLDGDDHGVLCGLSDNSRGNGWATAIRAGAALIEVHVHLRAGEGPDEAFALEPATLAHMVRFARTCDVPPPPYVNPYARCWWVTAPVRKGEAFTRANTRMLRPAGGVTRLHHRRAARDLDVGPLREEDIE